MSRRFWIAALAAAGLASASASALAGAKSLGATTVYHWGSTVSVQGTFGATRNSASTTEYLECGSNAGAGFCTYHDPSGSYYSCSTTDAAQIAAIRSMSGDSYVNFSYDTSTNACTYVLSYASSRAEPKNP